MPSLLKAKGLFTFTNELQVPEGSLEVADNVIIDEDWVIQPRRGFVEYGDELPSETDRVKQLLVYKERILRHYNDVLEFDDGTGVFNAFDGVYDETETGLRIKGKEIKSIEGIKKAPKVNKKKHK